ncbi:MAG: hypothetical protein PHX90_06900, partial [Thermotogota bacterium]|nr:hypothetical protein [Thermotogota bacterium]
MCQLHFESIRNSQLQYLLANGDRALSADLVSGESGDAIQKQLLQRVRLQERAVHKSSSISIFD